MALVIYRNKFPVNLFDVRRLNVVTEFKNGRSRSTVEHIRAVYKNLGLTCAIGMCKRLGFSAEGCVFILFNK